MNIFKEVAVGNFVFLPVSALKVNKTYAVKRFLLVEPFCAEDRHDKRKLAMEISSGIIVILPTRLLELVDTKEKIRILNRQKFDVTYRGCLSLDIVEFTPQIDVV